MATPEGGPLYIEPQRVIFDSLRDRRRMELMQQVQYLNTTIPPLPIPEEGYDLIPISFDSETRDDGATALFHLGDSDNSETFGEGEKRIRVNFVEPRTLQILDALGLPYVNHAAVSQLDSSVDQK